MSVERDFMMSCCRFRQLDAGVHYMRMLDLAFLGQDALRYLLADLSCGEILTAYGRTYYGVFLTLLRLCLAVVLALLFLRQFRKFFLGLLRSFQRRGGCDLGGTSYVYSDLFYYDSVFHPFSGNAV